MSADDTVLVTGATGTVGRRIVDELARAGVPVRALTRNPRYARMPEGVEVVAGSQTDPASLERHSAGVSAVFLVWPDLGDLTTADKAITAIASQASRIVFQSSAAVRDDADPQATVIGRSHREIERLIERSGLDWTFLRPWAFAANSLAWADDVRAGRAVRGAFGSIPVTAIDERDIAAVAVRALRDDRHASAVYELSGPELLTPVERLHIIDDVTGRRSLWADISAGEWARQIGADFGPAEVEELHRSYLAMADNPPPVTDTMRAVTGEPARRFLEWVRWHAAEFTDPVPDVARPDMDVATVGRWTLGSEAAQLTAADAALELWADSAWPDGLLRRSVLLGTDGRTVLHYAQWSSAEAADRFGADETATYTRIDRALPEIVRSDTTTHRLYRRVVPHESLPVGCVVVVSFDTDSQETGRTFVDTLLDRFHPIHDPDPKKTAGMISNNFHIATDGTGVINYAEFVDVDAHRGIVDGQLSSNDAVPKMIASMPGLTPLGFQRFLPYRSVTAPRSE
ncbi:NAD(P)H-binding protein [Nocardia sp. NBC_00508]|uniref:SDR family oxidoreductase n=1 Tax=Nocardia sp. NBC_00508 TaxID=2975992 RepID=UPI002E80C478|nr:NAD(P)H-binding protein [Nocardia sp. NBC_00508]WUD66713.1 NAD(P)H-binding protein [Nocardia sp. NBC_00508]